MKIYLGKRNYEISVLVCNWIKRFFGLMFCRRQNARILLFEFKKSGTIKIHSLFVFFPFLAVWLNNQNEILDIKLVKPFTFSVSSRKSYSKLIEIPLNSKNRQIIDSLVGDWKDLKR